MQLWLPFAAAPTAFSSPENTLRSSWLISRQLEPQFKSSASHKLRVDLDELHTWQNPFRGSRRTYSCCSSAWLRGCFLNSGRNLTGSCDSHPSSITPKHDNSADCSITAIPSQLVETLRTLLKSAPLDLFALPRHDLPSITTPSILKRWIYCEHTMIKGRSSEGELNQYAATSTLVLSPNPYKSSRIGILEY